MKTFLKVVAVGVALYLAITCAFYFVMSQSPDKIAKTMMHVPWAAFRVFPLRTVWMNARKGDVAGFLAGDHGSQNPCAIVELSRAKTCRAGVRKLHLTALPAGGSRSQQ